jgi:GT2 family glycosyltransferase/glycosyltransferase involved in cell wall biosynthesis/predicted O-methyltransferase YrrM
MYRFWETLIEPLLSELEPRVTVEIGAGQGANTRNLAAFCHTRGGVVHAIDPKPQFDVSALKRQFKTELVFHRSRSLDVLRRIAKIDAALIDGDHNWYTVFHELQTLELLAGAHTHPFPLVLLHDVAWPYGRRDLYYNAADIPERYRKPHRRRGMRPGSHSLVASGGLNPRFDNALAEGGPQNGVLTAVDDFLAQSPMRLTFLDVRGFHGLGILVSDDRLERRPGLRRRIQKLKSAQVLEGHIEEVERWRITSQISAEEQRRHRARLRRERVKVERALDETLAKTERARREAEERERELRGQLSRSDRNQKAKEAKLRAARAEAEDLRTKFAWSDEGRKEKESRLRASHRQAERFRAKFAQSESEGAARSAELAFVSRRLDELQRDWDAAPLLFDTRGMSVLFLLPTEGGGGGAHSVVQEAQAMRTLGVNAQVAIEERSRAAYFADYPSLPTEDLFYVYETLDDVIAYASRFDCVVGTIFHSMTLVKHIVDAHPSVLPAYYVQDYEPWFFSDDPPWRRTALESYQLVPGTVLFAKTTWLCDQVRGEHGVHVHKVLPSLAREVYFPTFDTSSKEWPVRVVAMIRPSTKYRGAPRTMRVLKRLKSHFGDRVEIHIFGCPDVELPSERDFELVNEGVLIREQVAELYRGADVFLDLSDWQGFGRIGLEAMACGCAIAVPAKGGAAEFAVDRVNALIVDTADEDVCFDAARELVENSELRHVFRAAGLEKSAEYSVRRAAISEIDVLSRALAARRGAAAVERADDAMQHKQQLERRDQESQQNHHTLDAVHEPFSELKTWQDDLQRAVVGLRKDVEYRDLRRDIHALVRKELPRRAIAAVVSNGDPALLEFEGRTGWHFPRGADGAYAGKDPSDSAAAIGHLEELRRSGAGFLVFPSTAFSWLEHYAEFRDYVDARYRRLWTDERCIIYALSERRRLPLKRRSQVAKAASNAVADSARSRYEQYRRLVDQIREVVLAVVPRHATVAVVSKGDQALLDLDGRTGWHFPRRPDGVYAGHYPRDSAAAIDHLEELRKSGVDFLVFPSTSFWWLEHYGDFRNHLDDRYRRVWADERCMVYGLNERAAPFLRRVRAALLSRRLSDVPKIGPAEAPRAEILPAHAPDTRPTLPLADPESARSFPVDGVRSRAPVELHKASVDIIICVHNALEDVKRCLESVLRHTNLPYFLLLIDDGSDEPTRDYLRAFASEHRAQLLRNDQALGYTIAANQGLRRTRADYVVLLNSDTRVTPEWLERLIACAAAEDDIGLVGPLSNAATWQSIPEIISHGEFAANSLPEGLTEVDMARLVAKYSGRLYPRMEFLNGFCLLIKRAVIAQIGGFDEETFGRGYGEENDYCLRARKAGWQLALADDTYVFHCLARSYTPERKRGLGLAANESLIAKHGREIVDAGVEICRHDRVLEGIRGRARVMVERESLLARGRDLWKGRKVAFVLPIHRPGGGANIVLHEAEAMSRMGIAVSIINVRRNREGYERSYGVNGVPVVYANDEDDVRRLLPRFDAVMGTWCESVYWLDAAEEDGRLPVRGYYIQDFEPFFFERDSAEYWMAWDSYTLYPDLIRVAKTEWDREKVKEMIGVESSVGGATLDIDVQRPRPRRDAVWPERPLRVLAMIRPSTPRRAPRLTMAVLRDMHRAYGEAIEIVIFGCDSDDPSFRALPHDFPWRNAGILNRMQVAALMNEIEIFVDFSEFQAQGLTAMEAMACGAAVIVPELGGSGTFVADERNGLIVDTSSQRACLEALERLVADDDLRARLQRQALLDICDFFPEAGAFRTLAALFGATQPEHRNLLPEELPTVSRLSVPELRLFPEKQDRAYQSSYAFDAGDLGLSHRNVGPSLSEVPGWLRPEDALKLYELAYFADGPILEIGTFHGKSTAIIASALRDANNAASFISLDINSECLDYARRTLETRRILDRATLFHGTSAAFFNAVPDFRPVFVFVDGDHSFTGVCADLVALESQVPAGGLILFHDYLDDRNGDPASPDYGVTDAIAGSWLERDCDFAGTFGCSGLFRRTSEGVATHQLAKAGVSRTEVS